jgi:hypothetical protein
MTTSEFDFLGPVKDLLSFSPRQGKSETDTALYLRNWLTAQNISFVSQTFTTKLPGNSSASLLIDGKEITCEPTSFVPGEIPGKQALISSLTSSQDFLYKANINFNPDCDGISLSNYYFAPSIAISRSDLQEVAMAKDVHGTVNVEPINHQSENILIGNADSPKAILIAHYDCIKTGATDNASGVSILMGLIALYSEILTDNLLIFSGNEELSYDEPIYWGHGFRVFEEEYSEQLFSAESVFIVDCVGNGQVQIFQDQKIAKLAFPIKDLNRLSPRLYMVSGDIDRLMKVYHSDADGIEELRQDYLVETCEALVAALSS